MKPEKVAFQGRKVTSALASRLGTLKTKSSLQEPKNTVP